MFKRREKSLTSRTEAEETGDLRQAIREKLTLLEQLQADYNVKAEALP
jgi:hypothetical protein